jgi:hypothetical protein
VSSKRSPDDDDDDDEMMSISPFGHKAVGDLSGVSEMY